MKRRSFLAATAGTSLALAQAPAEWIRSQWSARWITAAGAPPFDYGVYHFRRTFDLERKASRFVVLASADNRYQLFVNGKRVAWGPARGDLFHWRYETIDLAPFLDAGRNVLAAVVWNYGPLAPMAQITLETAFLLQGESSAERIADTGPNWRVFRNAAYSPIRVTSAEMRGYFVAGPGERVDGPSYPWGWESREFDDSGWAAAAPVSIAAGREARDAHTRWLLVPREIPPMEEKTERLRAMRRAEGITPPAEFPRSPATFRIAPNTKAKLLLDQGYLTTAYPEIVVSGGRGAEITLRYAEALYKPTAKRWEKGNRDEIEGKELIGYRDVFLGAGGAQRMFRPLWWRTYRYLELSVETGEEALSIEDLRSVFTGYPFARRAEFDCGSTDIAKIFDVGWRTARLCAHETYMDCPYYEQLQYVGDTRIQCLVSLFVSGDSRLMKNAIDQINDSRQSDGATMSRWPTRMQQYIPGFSLWWIGMVHDYWRYVPDPDFVRRMLPGVRAVLSFFERFQKPGGSLGRLPWWRYMDWVPEWQNGDAPQETDGDSACFDLQHLLALDWAADLEIALGEKSLGESYRVRARSLRATVQKLYWDDGRRLYADTPKREKFSQHANVLAVLGGVISGSAARDLAVRILTEPGIAQCTFYFRHYIFEALYRTGEGARYLDLLGDWHAMIKNGLTTFAEVPDRPDQPSRSDCHAWSASPCYELLRTVLGVDSRAPGFARVTLRPHLGKLTRAAGAVPHPRGMIRVKIDSGTAEIELPVDLTGEFVWKGETRALRGGRNTIPAV